MSTMLSCAFFASTLLLSTMVDAAVIGDWTTCYQGDTCSSSTFKCCVGVNDVSIPKATCRFSGAGSDCTSNVVPKRVANYMTCYKGDLCTSSTFKCCVGPMDVSIGKATCRPTNDCTTQPVPSAPSGTCSVGLWGSWSACTLSCGSGTQTRTRSLTGTGCTVTGSEVRSCNTQACAGPAPTPGGSVILAGTAGGTYYYDIRGNYCPSEPNGYVENNGYPTCTSFNPAYWQTLAQFNSNNVIAIDSNVLAANRALYCGKKVIVKYNGVQVFAPDGGDFFVWDGCAACVGGVRIDFSVSGLKRVNANACTLGVVPGVSYEIVNVQVKPFVP